MFNVLGVAKKLGGIQQSTLYRSVFTLTEFCFPDGCSGNLITRGVCGVSGDRCLDTLFDAGITKFSSPKSCLY